MEKRDLKTRGAGDDVRRTAPSPARRRWVVGGAFLLVAGLGGYALLIPSPGPGVWHGFSTRDTLKSGAAQGYNVLLITLDTTRADRLGCYGYEQAQTPALDGLAREGVVFTDAVTPYPLTLPSHASIMTGRYPPNHGVRDNGEYRLSEEHTTLAEVLKGQGYETAAFIGAFVLDARYGLDQGFDTYDDSVDPTTSRVISDYVNERSATRVTDVALEWLKGRDHDRPFFAWVHYFDPHQPYRAPEPFAKRFPDDPYDAEIAYMDSQIARLLRGVEEEGLKEKTLFIVVGDHGEGLGDHDEMTHGILIYDSVMHVPLILSCPGVFRGSDVVDDAVVSTIDIFATVIDLLAVSDVPPHDGESLLGAGAQGDRSVYIECVASYLNNAWAPLFGLRRLNDKYILAPRREYFDLRNDPGELNNLYVNPPARQVGARDSLVDELDRLLAKWPSVEEVASMALTVDAQSLARLESLGYVQTASPDPSLATPDPKDMMPVMHLIQQAKVLTRALRKEEALAVIRRAAAASPRDRTVLFQIARLCLMMDRVEEAEEALRKSIAIKPRAQGLVLLTQILILDGRFEEANKLLMQARTLEPSLGSIYIAHGDFARAKGRLREARDSYLHAMQVDPYRSEPTAKARLIELRSLIESRQQSP